jgi:hypothetical protein
MTFLDGEEGVEPEANAWEVSHPNDIETSCRGSCGNCQIYSAIWEMLFPYEKSIHNLLRYYYC